MDIEKIGEVKTPIIYISLTIIISSIVYGLYFKYFLPAAIVAGCFFIFILFSTNKCFTIFIVIIFLIGIGININYYNVNINKNFIGEIRVIENKSYYKIISFKGKRLYIQDFQGELGEKFIIKGIFTKEVDREKGIIGNIKVNSSKKIKEDFRYKLYELRKKIYFKLEENIGKRKAGLILSLAFGCSDYLDNEDSEDMRGMGVIHAVSVSGLHVALVYGILKKFLNNKIALLGTVIYVLLTGAEFSSLRALIMIMFLSFSFGLRKNYNSLGALAFSALIITLLAPYAPFKLGFQLSFLATLGIIMFSQKLNNKLYKFPKYLREIFSISLSAQVFTIPIMIIAFEEFSIAFIIGNTILVPIFDILIKLGNLLLIVLPFSILFDFISFIIYKVINFLDSIMYYLYIFPQEIIINKGFALIYVCALIGLYYGVKKDKKFILLPIIANFVFMIHIYSPIVRVDYYKEGAILVSYRGDRAVVTNKRNIDIKTLKKVSLTSKGYREGKKIKIKNGIEIFKDDKDFIIKIKEREYTINMSKKKNFKKEYDIIDFKNNNLNGFYILKDKIILY
ncbi:MAG: ComEC/Rec2 family competence protein [Clostridium sp.]|nr:ComEC/Rec2 family competence protein [Clostridium sp.]